MLIHLDWIGVVLSLTGWFAMARARFIALLIFILSNIVWLIWGIETNTNSIAFLQVCFIILNLRTIYLWYNSEYLKPAEFQDPSFIRFKGILDRVRNQRN